MTENKIEEPVEILHLSKEVMQEGVLYLREFAYSSDNLVFTRVSQLIEQHEEDGWHSKGWQRINGPDGNPLCWKSEGALKILADTAKRKGWKVEKHPAYFSDMSEYIKSIKF
jgi:hypothetical protein